MISAFRAICVLGALAIAQTAWAQNATTSGTSATTCTQSGSTLVCSSTTTVTLPNGTNLTGMSLNGTAPTTPACTSLTANPSVIPAGVTSSILLSVNGCPANSTYTYAWAAPVAYATGATTSDALLLSANSSPQTYSVSVCFVANPNQCSTYVTNVSVQQAVTIPSLSGCFVSPSNSSINVGGSATLTANCASGTGAGSNATYQWSKNGNAISGAFGQSYSLSANDTAAAGNTTYTVQINNGATTGNSASASATVTTVAVVAGATDYCPSTPVRATIAGTASFQRVWTSDITSSFPAGSTFVIQVNITDSAATIGRWLATLNFSDAGSERGGRYVTMSKSKCDFTESAQWLSPNFLGQKTAVNAGSGSIAIGAADTRSSTIKLSSNGTWYLNIQNVVGQCPAQSSCHAVIDWAN